tara:strand:- start:3074 stop:3217 length:144 start_codon:yes stop_codon:yes gene_type:complete
MGDKFPLLEALELAKLENLDMYFAKEYLKAASLGYALAQNDNRKSQS